MAPSTSWFVLAIGKSGFHLPSFADLGTSFLLFPLVEFPFPWVIKLINIAMECCGIMFFNREINYAMAIFNSYVNLTKLCIVDFPINIGDFP